MAKTKKTFSFKLKFVFWLVICLIGLAAILTGAILMGQGGPKLLWLPTALGIILFAIGLTLFVYLIVIERKREHVRSRGI